VYHSHPNFMAEVIGDLLIGGYDLGSKVVDDGICLGVVFSLG
jgi:hypothetical protein